MVPTTESSAAIGRRQQRVYLQFLQVGDLNMRALLEWDAPDFSAPLKMLRALLANEVC
jgi:hypothetical protein